MLSGRLTTVKVIYLYIKMFLTPCGRKFSALKDKHKNQNVYVIGNGPSLTISDLELIKSKGGVCIAVNGIFYLFDKTEWRPDYYFFSDVCIRKGDEWAEFRELFKKWIHEMPIVIYNRFYWNDKTINSNMIPYKTNVVRNVLKQSKSKYWNNKSFDCKFSTNAKAFVYDGDSCIHSVLQLCYYMGFKNVFLLGVDCASSEKKSHAYEEDLSQERKEYIKSCFPNMIRDYIALYDDMKKKHIPMEIYNATRGGNLEVFKRISLENSFSIK